MAYPCSYLISIDSNVARLIIAGVFLIIAIVVATRYFIKVIWAQHIELKIIDIKSAILDSHAENMRLYQKFQKKWQGLDMTNAEIESEYRHRKQEEDKLNNLKKEFK